MNNRVVLVSGASTGIGLVLLKQLQQFDFRVVATARKESLSRFASAGIKESEKLIIRALDVTEFDAHYAVIQEIYGKWGQIDVLVNNAGISFRSVQEHMDRQCEIEQFNTNYFGPMNLIRMVLPRMRENRRGHIINVSSVGGMMAMPTMGTYSASKFALEGASEALWYECRPWNIHVSLIEPGFIHSNSFRKVRLTEKSELSSKNESDHYHRYYHYMKLFIEKNMMHRAIATPETIAKKIIKVIHGKSPVLRVPATIDAWLFYYLRRILPRRVYHRALFRSLPHIKKWVPNASNDNY